MFENMAADLSAGYDLHGKAIVEQRQAISAYEKQMNDELDLFKTMDEKSVNRWCFYDLKKRGAIL